VTKKRDIRSVRKEKLADLLRWARENGEHASPSGPPQDDAEGGKKNDTNPQIHKKPSKSDHE